MEFPPGRPILLILLFALLGGAGVLVNWSRGGRTDQTVWVFDASHADTYQFPSGDQPPLTQMYKQRTGKEVQIQLLAARALDARLLSLTLANTRGEQVPDVVEIEIGSVGKYFRAPADQNGLLPLDSFIAKDPEAQQLLPARLAVWSEEGQVFGIPHDVHPVSITYRKDLFREAGVSLEACKTWPEFQDACLRYQEYWHRRGLDRRAIQLSRWNASDLMILLQQQRIELIDAQHQLHLADPRVAKTIAFYASLLVGDRAIAAPVTASSTLYVQDLADAHSAALLTPDWRIAYLRFHPNLLGRLAMMPLPRFDPGDAPTASWGGTMVAIPRNCRDPQASWQLLRFLQLSPEAMHARQFHSNILPAVRSAWDEPGWKEPDPLYDGQRIGELYVQLARQLPEQRSSPYATMVSQAVSAVLSSAQEQLRASGPAGLEEHCQQKLLEAQTQLTKLLAFAEGQP